MNIQQTRIYVCHGLNCSQHQARLVWSALTSEVRLRGLDETCELIVSGCQGRCDDGPNLNVYPNLTKYAHVTPEKARQIIREHVEAGHPVVEYVYCDER